MTAANQEVRETPERCIACNERMRNGDAYLPDADGGVIHAACCGPERESYVGPDGEPLREGEPLPERRHWIDPNASATVEEAIARLGSESWSLICKAYPTVGGDDGDVGYEVISYHMAKPTERVEGMGSSPLDALRHAGLLALTSNPSPEPKASNAGAVEALREAEIGLAAVIRLSEMGYEESMKEPEENGNFASYERAKRALARVRAALSTAEIQIGERNGNVVSDPERIWLQNAKDGEASNDGRLWCADKIWPDDALDGEPTEYVRADLYEAAGYRLAEVEEPLRELVNACEGDCGVPGDGDEDDEAVGASEEGPMALTFGMLRRARAALRTKPEAQTLAAKEGADGLR